MQTKLEKNLEQKQYYKTKALFEQILTKYQF